MRLRRAMSTRGLMSTRTSPFFEGTFGRMFRAPCAAQFGANETAVRDIVRRIQTRTDSLQRAVQNAADRNNYRLEDVERMILDFESAAMPSMT